VQGSSTSSDIAAGVGFAVNFGVGCRRRQQVGLEGAIVAADVAALQAITQCGRDGSLVEGAGLRLSCDRSWRTLI